MGMLVWVYRTPLGGDCTANGISKDAKCLCLVNVEGPFTPDDETPAALLVKRDAVGNVVIVECTPDGRKREGWSMFGGNFAYTSDSRFSEAVQKLSGYKFSFPVSIHDRYEG